MRFNADDINGGFGLNEGTAAIVLKTNSDSLVLGDSANKIALKLRQDSLTMTDTGRMLYWTVDVQELLTTFDQLTRWLRDTRLLTDALAVSDSANKIALKLRADSAAVIDERISGIVRGRVTSDLLTAFDQLVSIFIPGGTGTVYTKDMVDNLTVLDQLFDWLLRQRQGSDTTLVSDQLFDGVVRGRVTSDNTLLVDGFVSGVTRGRTQVDTVSVSDPFFRQLYKVASDSLTVSDGYVFSRLLTRALGDAITVIDGMLSQITGAGAIYVRTASDTLTIGDGTTTYMLRRRSLDESLTIVDERVSGAVRNRRFDDLVAQIVDASVKGVARGRVTSDNLVVSDQTIRTLLRVIAATDSLTLIDGTVTAFLKTRALTDLLQITDETIKQLFASLTFDVRIVIGLEDRIRVGATLDGMPVVGEDASFITVGGYH
jgi:hypothetical protein